MAGGAASIVQGEGSTGGGEGKEEIQTLSIPFTHYHDGRFVQPWFAATYYEALILPASGGGLEVRNVLFGSLSVSLTSGYPPHVHVLHMTNSLLALDEPRVLIR